jgi:hypothetical protein
MRMGGTGSGVGKVTTITAFSHQVMDKRKLMKKGMGNK